MRRIISVLPFLLLLAAAWIYRAPVTAFVQSAAAEAFPCRWPITYKIGSFDERFGISEADFLAALADAEKVWEAPSGRNLFRYDPEGMLTVNLVYDTRQEATDRLKTLGVTIEDNKKTYDELSLRYSALKAQYDKDKAAFNAALADYTRRKSAYESKVSYWNSRGGAPSREYAALQTEKKALETQFAALSSMKDELNKEADTVNAVVDILNRLAAELNVTAANYNRIGDARGAEFEEGIFEVSRGRESITIYQFENRTKLVRVLAHELGHALGLPHLEDAQAIMYRLNQGSAGTAAKSDLTALVARCNSTNLPFPSFRTSAILNFNN